MIVFLVISSRISEDFLKQKIVQSLEGKSGYSCEIGQVSFSWPNRIEISRLDFQKKEQDKKDLIRCEDILGTARLFPLLTKKIDMKNIAIQHIDYKNQYSIRNLTTEEFSFRNDTLFTHAQLLLNDGLVTFKGIIEFLEKEPTFDVFIEVSDVHITGETLHLFPFFAGRENEIGGFLSLKGHAKGKGADKEAFNRELQADMRLKLRDGYIRGNKIVSSLLTIAGIQDAYSFDFLEAEIQIREGKIHTPEVEMKGQMMNVNASGTADFEGILSYDAQVMFNKDYLGKDMKKIIGFILKQNTLQVEIRGTAREPKVSVKLPGNTLDHVIKDLAKEFFSNPKKAQRKEKTTNELD
ncbi:MAG: hypothetical protein ACUBOA_02385 [Candidatus Loosdrechtia sp.]